MVIFQKKKKLALMSSNQKTATTPATTTTQSSDVTPGFQLNQKKLKELAENASAIKIGGKVGGASLSLFAIRFYRSSNVM